MTTSELDKVLAEFFELMDNFRNSKLGKMYALASASQLKFKRVSNKGTKRKKFGVLKVKGL